MKNYYYILGINESANEQEIKTAYRKLSLKFHPDQNNGDKFFEERFKEIQEAYETLNNPNKRKTYDKEFKSFYDNEQEPNFQNSKKSNENSYYPKNESNFKKKNTKKRPVVTAILVIGGILLIFTIVRVLIRESISQYAYNQGKKRYNNSIQSKVPEDLKTKKLYSNSNPAKLTEKRKHTNEDSVLNKKNLNDKNLERIEIYDTCELIGTLSLKHFYGPPGWGEDTTHDRKEYNSQISQATHLLSKN